MTSFLSLLPADGWPRLLCDALWQSTLIATIGLVVAKFLVRQSAARAWLLLLTLTACFLTPLASLAVRQQGFALFPATATNVAANQTVPEPPVEPGAIGTIDESTKPAAFAEKPPVLPGVGNSISQGVGDDSNVVAWFPDHATAPTAGLPVGGGAGDLRSSPSAGSGDPRTTAITTTRAPTNKPPVPPGVWAADALAIVWLTASAFLVIRLTLSLAATWRLLRRAKPCHDPALLSAANSAAQRIGLPKAPPLLISADVQTPTIFCLGRTRLLIPQNTPSVDWVAAFTHELAHVKRGDGWSRLWAEFVAIALPLSLLVWLARRAFHTACEEACDDWAVAAGANPVDLAETLTAWINVRQQPALLAAIGMSSTKARTLRLLSLREMPIVRLNRTWRWLGISVALLLTAGFALAQTSNALKDQKPATDKGSPAATKSDEDIEEISLDDPTVKAILQHDPGLAQISNQVESLQRAVTALQTATPTKDIEIEIAALQNEIKRLHAEFHRNLKDLYYRIMHDPEKLHYPGIADVRVGSLPSNEQIEKALADDALVALYSRQLAGMIVDWEKEKARPSPAPPLHEGELASEQLTVEKSLKQSIDDLKGRIEKRKADIRPRIIEKLSEASTGAIPAAGAAKADRKGLGPYIIEPPDILTLDPLQLSPKKPVRIVPGDKVRIDADGTRLDSPINAVYKVDSAGEVVLGPNYGTVKIAGLTRREAEEAVTAKLGETLANPTVALTIDESRLQDGIAGQHLVGPDGTINLGTYGRVKVDGMTIEVATKAVKDKLSTFFSNPIVSVDVYAFNSKVYYVIVKGEKGDTIQRFPITGNETVLDALAQLKGMGGYSQAKIWISRTVGGNEKEKVIHVDWNEALQGNTPQILSGDRIFIEATRSAYAPEPSGQGDSYYGAPVPPSAYPPSRSDSNPMKLPHAIAQPPTDYESSRATTMPYPPATAPAPAKDQSRNDKINVDFGQPVVVKTIPEAGVKDVDPNLTEIKVTFSREMSDGKVGVHRNDGDNLPKMTGDPHFLEDKRTCVLPVKLEPGKTYSFWLNDAEYAGIFDADGRYAAPYLLVFKTKDAGPGIK